ncbi:MAG TPA: ABC transporter permease [Opitutaceae bacterium]|jgi:predicted permease
MPIALRCALRQLTRAPAFTATALLTLVVCLGANLTIFAVVDAILLRSLPFRDPGRLVCVVNAYPGAGIDRAGASIANYFERRDSGVPAFSSVSLYHEESLIVGGQGRPERARICRVTPEFFATLGVPLAMGRMFTDADLDYSTDQVAVLTDAYWRRRFGADPRVVGRTFLNDELKVTVVGVLPAGFEFLSTGAQFYRPLSHDRGMRLPDRRDAGGGYQMVARLAPGFTLAQAQAQVDASNAAYLKLDPLRQRVLEIGFHSTVYSFQADYVRGIRLTLILLQAGACVLMAIGTVNLVNLLLIRASARSREVAIRQALGARRWQVARETLVETALLTLIGCGLGVLAGYFGVDLVRAIGADQLPLGSNIRLDGPVLVASALVAAAAVPLLAAPIAWFHLRGDFGPTLHSDSRGGTVGRVAIRLRQGFIVAQVALAFVLLASAGLLGVSLRRVLEVRSGFDTEHVLTGNISLPWNGYRDIAAKTAFAERLIPALRSIPGVSRAGIGSGLPFSGNVSDSAVAVEGRVMGAGDGIRAHYISGVAGDYWQAMGIPLVHGRFLDDSDVESGRRVCVVDKAFADRYWPGKDALGRRIAPFDVRVTDSNTYAIVGVVGAVKQGDLAEEGGHGAVYLPFSAQDLFTFAFAVRSQLPAGSLVGQVRQAVRSIDPNLPADDVRPILDRIDDTLVARRSPAILAALFAAVALMLAVVGTYGVLSYAVAQRRREIGVRMAVGAQPGQIQRQFLGAGMRLVALGGALGLLGAYGAGAAMRSILFGVPAFHPGTILLAASVMGSVALVACFLPARRASKVDPVVALRGD